MSMQGADIQQLRMLAKRMSVAQTHLRGLADQVTAQLDSSPWQGSDAHRFRAEWVSQHRAVLLSTGEQLGRAGETVLRHAEEQEQASTGTAAGSSAALAREAATNLGDTISSVLNGFPDSFTSPISSEHEDGPRIPAEDGDYVPQGLGYDAEHDELVSTYYTGENKDDGQIVFQDRQTGEVTSRVPLTGMDHYGGVAVEGDYTYVSGNDENGDPVVQVYRTSDLREGPQTVESPVLGDVPLPAEPVDTVEVATASTITVHDGSLYAVQFTEDADDPGAMYRYDIGDDGIPVEGSASAPISIPGRTQGLSFRGDDVYFSRSYTRGDDSMISHMSMSQLQSSGWQDDGDSYNVSAPNMSEGTVVVDRNLYTIYESGADAYTDDGYGPDFLWPDTEPRDHFTVHDLPR